MALLSDADRVTLTQHLAPITKNVDLLLFTQTIGGTESGLIAKQVIDEVASLHEKISVVEKNFVLDTEDKTKYGIDKAPALVVLADGQDTRMRMFGANTGYEFVPLIEAVLMAGTGNVELMPSSLEAIAAVDKPMHIQVFSTPT